MNSIIQTWRCNLFIVTWSNCIRINTYCACSLNGLCCITWLQPRTFHSSLQTSCFFKSFRQSFYAITFSIQAFHVCELIITYFLIVCHNYKEYTILRNVCHVWIMPFTSDAYMLPHPSDSILALCHYVIKLRVDGLVVPQDPAQSKRWGLMVSVLCQPLVLCI